MIKGKWLNGRRMEIKFKVRNRERERFRNMEMKKRFMKKRNNWRFYECNEEMEIDKR